MDGNGRWAKQRGHARTRGHHEGAKRVDEIVTECCRIGVEYLTLYAFSTENWNRPAHEVNLLMRLLVQQLRKMEKKLQKNSVALSAQGTLERLPKYVQAELNRVIQTTAHPQPKLRLNLSLSYGGRQEIVDAAKRLAEQVKHGELPIDAIDEKVFRTALYRPEFPDPDLLIRTGGDFRLSNFLLWESAYTELLFIDSLWPEFTPPVLLDAIKEYSTRQRRFGKTSEQVMKVETEAVSEQL